MAAPESLEREKNFLRAPRKQWTEARRIANDSRMLTKPIARL